MCKMPQQQTILRWKYFQSNITSSICDLFTKTSSCDVTLVSDDQIHFKAHKFVLTACSPTLKHLLLNNPHSHPLIYLKGVEQQELELILQFMYCGEAAIYENRIDIFLDNAKDLQIKQLTDSLVRRDTFVQEKHTKKDKIVEYNGIPHCYITAKHDDAEQKLNETRSINSMIDESLDLEMPAYNPDEKVKYACNWCEYQATTLRNLNRHKRAVHVGIRLSCNQCEYQTRVLVTLKRHKQSQHEGVRYLCNQCDYQAKDPGCLTRHRKSKHEGIKYSCDECEYQATLKSSLNKHKQSLHEGVVYSCDQCEYFATQKSSLRTHKKGKHAMFKC
jgi:hypothetical protein